MCSGVFRLEWIFHVFDIWCFICKHKILDFGVLFLLVLCCGGVHFFWCVCCVFLLLFLFLGEFRMTLSIMGLIQHFVFINLLLTDT